MGIGQSCLGIPSSPKRLRKASHYVKEEEDGGLATSVISLVKDKCLLSRKRSSRNFHPPHWKQNEREIISDDHNANGQYAILEEWLLSSLVLEKSSANSETHLFKHFSNRVHPASLDHTELSSNRRSSFSEDKLLKELNGELADGSFFLKPEQKREDEEEGWLQIARGGGNHHLFTTRSGGTRCKCLKLQHHSAIEFEFSSPCNDCLKRPPL